LVEFSTILQFIQAFGIIVGVAYYILNIENNRKNQELGLKSQKQALETRQMQLFMQLYNDINSEPRLESWAEIINMKPSYKEYIEKYDSSVNIVFYAKRASLWYTYNTIGEMLRLEMIETELLHRLNVDVNIIVMWDTWSPIIEKNREVENMPDLWDGFEYLYKEMKTLRDSKGYPEITINR